MCNDITDITVKKIHLNFIWYMVRFQVLPQMQKKIEVLMEKFGAAVKAGQPVDVLE